MRILIVDDNLDVAEVLALLMETEGHEATAAGSGREAIDLAEADTFDVVLVDMLMPGMDGTAVVSHLRTLPTVPWLIAMSGLPGAKLAALAAGFDAALTKPVDPEDIQRLLAGLPPR